LDQKRGGEVGEDVAEEYVERTCPSGYGSQDEILFFQG
jgi:hypothetical protein